MKSIDEIVNDKPEIEIGGEVFKIMYNHWSLMNPPLIVNLAEYKDIAQLKDMTRFLQIVDKAMEMIIAGIITSVIIKTNGHSAFDTGILEEQTEQKIKEIKLLLKIGVDGMTLLRLFLTCLSSYVNFMPTKGGDAGGEIPPTPPRRKK